MSRKSTKKQPGIFEREKGSGVWSICYFDAEGRRHREVIGNKQKALDAYNNRKTEIRYGKKFPQVVTEVKISKLAEDLIQKYHRDGIRSVDNAERFRWKLHLRPFFANVTASGVTSDLLARYVEKRQKELNRRGRRPSNATINRELSFLRAAFYLALEGKPPKVSQVPPFPMLKENNVRKGFVKDAEYGKLAAACAEEGLWLRALVGVAYNYGWRRGELANLRVRQVDLAARAIQLEPGSTKNKDARTVIITSEVFELLKACVTGKGPDDLVFTRDDGGPVGDFRKVWQNVCIRAGLGRMVCRTCEQPVSKKKKCEHCKKRNLVYAGLIFHDLRRTGCRNLRRLGVSEGTIMKIGGWKTRSVFDRYNIVDEEDIRDAAMRLDEKRRKQEEEKAPSRKRPPVPSRIEKSVSRVI